MLENGKDQETAMLVLLQPTSSELMSPVSQRTPRSSEGFFFSTARRSSEISLNKKVRATTWYGQNISTINLACDVLGPGICI